MSANIHASLFFGCALGLFIGLLIAFNDMETAVIYNKAIAKCELNLPRDQHCEIVAVVAHKKGE